MPVLTFKMRRLLEALESKVSLDQLVEILSKLKGEVEVGEEVLQVELEVDRPDMYTVEGIVRAVKGFLGWETGLPSYSAVRSGYTIVSEEVPTRPYVAGVVVWDVNVDEDFLEELIQFQEKLHVSLASRRARAAIGFHDLDKLPSKTLYYRFEDIDSVRFVPLHHDKEMSLREVLEETEQGREYGSISLSSGRHPVLYSGSEVIAVPPVINAELTRVEPGTRHLFVDITGTDEKAVMDLAAVIAANLAERSTSKRIGLVTVIAPYGVRETPGQENQVLRVNVDEVSKWTGWSFTPEELAALLRRARFDAKPLDGHTVEVVVPWYRVDVMHWVDIAEEALLMLGFEKLGVRKPRSMLRGELLGSRAWERKVRDLLIGYGFQELYSFTLISCRDLVELGGASEDELVKLENPVSMETDCLRSTLVPVMLRIAQANQHNVPLKAFELGEVVVKDEKSDTKTRVRKRLGIVVMGRKAGFEDVQAYVYGLIRLLGDEIVEVRPCKHKVLIEGRTACLTTRYGIQGVLGEVHPMYLERLGIKYPVALAELDYTELKVVSAEEGVPHP